MALIPTSWPSVLTSAPPELPALMAASVCMNDSTLLAPSVRALAEMMPAVTVLLSPSGLPMASTHSPTLTLSLLAMLMAGRFLPSILMRARSVVLSLPMMRAEYSLLSERVTVNSSAPSTTWLLVTIYPSLEMMTPEPVAVFLGVCTLRFCLPLPWPRSKNPKGSKKPPKGSSTSTVCILEFCTYLICTTAGRARSAAVDRSTGCAGMAVD